MKESKVAMTLMYLSHKGSFWSRCMCSQIGGTYCKRGPRQFKGRTPMVYRRLVQTMHRNLLTLRTMQHGG
jgi:hypothetical protein